MDLAGAARAGKWCPTGRVTAPPNCSPPSTNRKGKWRTVICTIIVYCPSLSLNHPCAAQNFLHLGVRTEPTTHASEPTAAEEGSPSRLVLHHAIFGQPIRRIVPCNRKPRPTIANTDVQRSIVYNPLTYKQKDGDEFYAHWYPPLPFHNLGFRD